MEELGRRVLADLERNTCTLDEVILALSARAAPQKRAFTRLPVLDDIVNASLSSRVSAAQTTIPSDASSTVQYDAASGLNTNDTPRPTPLPTPPIIQLDGLGLASGRTQLLYLAAARCLLGYDGSDENQNPQTPAATEGLTTEAGERSAATQDIVANTPGAVLWFDLHGKFSATRLEQILIAEIRRVDGITASTSSRHPGEAISDEEAAPSTTSVNQQHTEREKTKADPGAIALDALDHIHVFRPHSTNSLIATLDSVPFYLASNEHKSQDRPLTLIVLAGLSAFWWIDRHESELDSLGLLMSQQQSDEPNDKATAEGDETNDSTDPDTSATITEQMLQQTPQTEPQNPDHPRPQKPTDQSSSSSSSLFHTRWRSLIRSITDLQRRYAVPVLASDMCLGKAKRCRVWRGNLNIGIGSAGANAASRQISRDSTLSLAVQPHLPASWTSSVSVRFLLRRVRRRWPVAISAVEIVEEQARRRRQREQQEQQQRNEMINVAKEAIVQGSGDRQALRTRERGRLDGPRQEDDDEESKDYEDGNGNVNENDEVEVQAGGDSMAGSEVGHNVTVSNLLVNMHGSENWTRATWDALEPWRAARKGVLRMSDDLIQLSNA